MKGSDIHIEPFEEVVKVRVRVDGDLKQVMELPRSSLSSLVTRIKIMIATPAIRNLIREEKIHQIQSSIQTGGSVQMQTMDDSLIELYRNGYITKDTALSKAADKDEVKKYL